MQFTVFQSCCRLQATYSATGTQSAPLGCMTWATVMVVCTQQCHRMPDLWRKDVPKNSPEAFLLLTLRQTREFHKVTSSSIFFRSTVNRPRNLGMTIIFPYFPFYAYIFPSSSHIFPTFPRYFFHHFFHYFPWFSQRFSKGSTLRASAAAAAPSPRCAGTVRCAAGAMRRWAATERRRRRRRWWPRWERLRCWGCGGGVGGQ